MNLGRYLRRSAVWVAIGTLVVTMAACEGVSSGAGRPADESILRVDIPGTSNGKTSTTSNGTVTKLFDVDGDWTQVSIELAGIVRAEGWTITSLNCVGTGNDVIAKKQVGREWLLLESGAGARGAGVIVSRDSSQQPPGTLRVTGRCPTALVNAVD